MRSIRGAQALASRSLLLSSRALHGAAASTAAAAAGGGRLGVQPSPPSQASSSSSSRAMPAGIAGAVSFSLTFATMAAAEAKERPPMDLLPQNVVLYQYQACPFCNKVRAFLDYHDIPYKVVEVNPLSKKEIKWSEYKKVPILTVDGEQLVDSSDIINILQQRIHPDDKVTNEEEEKWRRWVDEHLVHVLSPNIYRTTSEALESFDYISKHGNFSFTERFAVKYAGAAAMYMVSKKLKKKYNITDARASLYDAANTWMGALNGRDFLGGSKPNLADLAVFGVLRPIRYLTAGKDMVEHTQIGDWYQRMEDAIGEPSRIQ
uniref:Prostaglandin E synthase 2 n=1 Tax=Oryza punctata TaxID=4537 RepID=A0A0E0KNC2_ORYPU